MELLYENPLPAILIGGLSALILAAGWLKTGSRWLLAGLLVAIALTVTLVLVERFVETDREQITATLYRIANLVEHNEITEAVEYAYSGAPEVGSEALEELSNYRFSSVRIKRNLEVDVFPDEAPPRAVAEFNVVVVVSTKNGLITDRQVPRYVEVTFMEEDDGPWRVSGYRHYEPLRGFQEDPVTPYGAGEFLEELQQ